MAKSIINNKEVDLVLDNLPSPLHIELTLLRSDRNSRLQETDFYALSDVTMSDAMKTYRQELRDITEGIVTVEQARKVVWPTKPGS